MTTDLSDTEYFEYNGQRSNDFDLYIHNELEFVVPKPDIEEVEVMGRDGVVLIDNERREPIRKSVRLDLRLPQGNHTDGLELHERVREIAAWLSVKGWHDFRWSMYPGYVWKATFKDSYGVQDKLRHYGRTVVQVLFHPTMRIENQEPETIENGHVFENDTNEQAKPLIEIVGNGDMTFYNNGSPWFRLTGVDRDITIDSELMQVYNDRGNEWLKMDSNIRPLFPLLLEGNNEITWEGDDIQSVTIHPRFEVQAT